MRYGEEGTSVGDRTLQMTSEAVISLKKLTKETVYTIEVAANTSAGIGVYSHPQSIETPDSESSFFTSVDVL